ncbi:hypothetical protein HDU99_008324, partial [Rhizoclosmatium hyalinum]
MTAMQINSPRATGINTASDGRTEEHTQVATTDRYFEHTNSLPSFDPNQNIGFGVAFSRAAGFQRFIGANLIVQSPAQSVTSALFYYAQLNAVSCCLKSHHGLYLSANPDGVLTADRTWSREWEHFHLVFDGDERRR